jgi:hypothetical protein
MPDTITPISLTDALALAAAIPDVITLDGDATAKRRALAVEITRQGANGEWITAIPREELITLTSGKIVTNSLAPFRDPVASVATKTVTLTHPDGRQFIFPVILIQALIGAYYVSRENGDLIPDAPQPLA